MDVRHADSRQPTADSRQPTADSRQPTAEELDALAADVHTQVDANPDTNKVVLLAHMQLIGIEQELAARLSEVDVSVAGESTTRLFDETDVLRAGDSDQGTYPIIVRTADGSYKYVGRLVMNFDADGHIIADSDDPTVSGPHARDEAGVAALEAEASVDPEFQAIADTIETQIFATEGHMFSVSDVSLSCNRTGTYTDDDPDGLRTRETNLGNLTADANFAAAQAVDASVVVSIKNGGGDRDYQGVTFTVTVPDNVFAVRRGCCPLSPP